MSADFKALEAIVKDLERAKEAVAVLENVWGEIGPYGEGKMSETTRHMMQRFFKFDDSE